MILSPGSLAGGWESLDGSPDFYICLLAYSLDAEYGRGSFSLYRIDGEGCHIRIGTKECRFMSEGCPHTLHVMGWGRYMRN